MTTTVLIIDDQEPVMEVFAYALSKMDCQVDWAASGARGLQMLMAKDYDIVFLDLNLGGSLDGVATLKQMRFAGSRVPVYIITGFYENYADPLKALTTKYGICFEVMRKPIDVAILRQVIDGLKQQPEAR